jgi:[ribosomal protein S18]-alanine N-acetyltransferase
MSNPEGKPLLVRPANSLDLPAIKALEQLSATAAHWSPGQYEHLVSESSPRTVLVIEDNSKHSVQGFLAARNVTNEWEIENIVVSNHRQRQGLGTRLLREFLSYAKRKGAEAIFLEVRESNLAARALYRSLNFAPMGSRKRYYRNPEEDAIVYRLEFT